MNKIKNPFLKYAFNIAISLDQMLNTFALGDVDETVSSRIGKIKAGHGGKIPWNHGLAKLIDAGLEAIQKGHCINAIEADEGADAVLKDHDYPGA
jgi:hypothetical protein